MSDLPEPLTPADCDLRDFQFMPLDCSRLRDSKLVSHVPPAQCFFAVILWCASWHQIPAASLPDDDIELARLAGFGFVVKEWRKVKGGALYGWVKCSDGRLYHPVVAEKARDAWQAKHEQRWRAECGRIKKHNQRHGTSIPYPTLDEFLSPDYVDQTKRDKQQMSPGTEEQCPENVPGTIDTRDREVKGQGQGRDREKLKEAEPDGSGAGAPPPPELTPAEALFQVAVPWLVARDVADKTARSLLGGARKQLGDEAAWALASECIRVAPLEPTSWLAAAINARIAKKPAPRANGMQARSDANIQGFLDSFGTPEDPMVIDMENVR